MSTQTSQISIYNFSINYIDYKSKQPKKKNQIKIDFGKINSSRLIHTSSKGASIYQSKNNASIYQSAKGSIYASAIGSIGNSNNSNSNLNQSDIFESIVEGNANKFEQPNMDLFQSAREDDLLINSFNDLIDYDFFFIEIHIIKINNNDKKDVEHNDNFGINNYNTRFAKSIDFTKLIEDCSFGKDNQNNNQNKENIKEEIKKESFEVSDCITCYTLKNTVQVIEGNTGYSNEEMFIYISIPKIFIEFHPV